MEQIPAVQVWDCVLGHFHIFLPERSHKRQSSERHAHFHSDENVSSDTVDHVPPNIQTACCQPSSFFSRTRRRSSAGSQRGRSLCWRHVARSLRVDLDWLFERINLDRLISIGFVRTTEHLADNLNKSAFTPIPWTSLIRLLIIHLPFA